MRDTTPASTRLRSFAAASATAIAVALGACGGDGSDASESANPESAGTEAEFAEALAGAPPKLAELYEDANTIIEGGPEVFEQKLARLQGHPVVVNKWASWCGPCRYEFPFFQEAAVTRGKEIAFIGVNADDSTDAAETFLAELPLPYPSISDPDDEIAELIEGFFFPSTAFYSAEGELVYTRLGPYDSAADLNAEIDKYLG